MRIVDLLDTRSINLSANPKTKSEALDQAVELMDQSGKLSDKEEYRKKVYAREEESTTGIGEGIAIPHGKCDAVLKPGLAAMVIPKGVDFESLDGEPADLLFLIAAPNTEDNVHLDVLSKLSMLLMDEDFTKKLKAAKTVEEFLKVIDDAETNRDEASEETKEEGKKFLIGVTACPTGIAHTYMAAEALEKKAKELGLSVKIETRGSGGAKNVLTTEDINKADGIIVAADTKVPMERFKGKKVLITKVADGINKSEDLIKKALAGQVPVYEGGSSDAEEKKEYDESLGRKAYKHLMSGVSHMLPFVIGGGILVALAFLVDTLCGYGNIGETHPELAGSFGMLTPLSAWLKYVGGLAMGLMVPVLAGYIAYSIADRPGLVVGFTGGLLASSGNALLSGYLDTWKTLGSNGGLIQKLMFQHSGNTVSGFLGGIAAGFLAGAIVLLLKKIFANLPAVLDGIKPTLLYPVLGVLCISILMCLILNPIIGLINTGLSNGLNWMGDHNMLIVLGAVLGAMMAIDMGGPINKAAYVFGTGMLTQAATELANGAAQGDVKNYYIMMAAVMVGGMVPPVGIAIAELIFPKKFTKDERGSIVSNFVMGAGFITEAAIPFAAADPGHVIPATMIGAGVAGGLSAAFGCTLMAPHGGVFVFATVGNPLLYVLAWVIGSFATALLLGALKKNVNE